jgi:hypothetical protein
LRDAGLWANELVQFSSAGSSGHKEAGRGKEGSGRKEKKSWKGSRGKEEGDKGREGSGR